MPTRLKKTKFPQLSFLVVKFLMAGCMTCLLIPRTYVVLVKGIGETDFTLFARRFALFLFTCPQLPVLGNSPQPPLLASINIEYLILSRNLLTIMSVDVDLNTLFSTLCSLPLVLLKADSTSIFPLVYSLLVPNIQGVRNARRKVTFLLSALRAKARQ